MKSAGLLFVAFATSLLSIPARAQEPLANSQIKGLKGIHNIAVVLRLGATDPKADEAEWGDAMVVALHARLPELRVVNTDETGVWLELSIVSDHGGAQIAMSVYRQARLIETADVIFTKVWWKEWLVLNPDRTTVRDRFNALMDRFAADFLRANTK